MIRFESTGCQHPAGVENALLTGEETCSDRRSVRATPKNGARNYTGKPGEKNARRGT